jgi:hypothetical protein
MESGNLPNSMNRSEWLDRNARINRSNIESHVSPKITHRILAMELPVSSYHHVPKRCNREGTFSALKAF